MNYFFENIYFKYYKNAYRRIPLERHIPILKIAYFQQQRCRIVTKIFRLDGLDL